MVKKSIISLSIVAAVFSLSGCGGSPTDSTNVSPTATKATEHFKADTPQDLIDSEKKPFVKFDDSSPLESDTQDGAKLIDKATQSITKDLQNDEVANQDDDPLDSCIKITGTSSDDTIDKTVTFDHCELIGGSTLNGTISVKAEDDNASGTEIGNAMISVNSLNLKKDNDNEILISIAKISSEWSINREGNISDKGEITTTELNASAGISAYLMSGGKKILILDGLNGKASLDAMVKECECHCYNGRNKRRTLKGIYTGSIEGYVGDAGGLLKVETPKTVKGDGGKTGDCPSEGEITLTDADGKKAIFSANGKSITLTYNDQNKTLEKCKEVDSNFCP